jgi:O-antigen ligase
MIGIEGVDNNTAGQIEQDGMNLIAKFGTAFRLGKPAYEKTIWFLWAALLVLIPFTSSPIIEKTLGKSTVGPLSLIPLGLLVILWLIPFLLRQKVYPLEVLPLVVFIIIVFLGALRSPFLELYSFVEIGPLTRTIRGLITLAIGLCFYLSASFLPVSEEKIKSSVRLIFIGALITLVWASIQMLALPNSDNPPPPVLMKIHRWFSVRDMIRGRISGFAFEPSWLADQLVILYMPLALAGVIRKKSVFNFRLGPITFELMLVLWGSLALFLTYSRIGYAAFFFSIGLTLLLLSRSMARSTADWLRKRFSHSRFTGLQNIRGRTVWVAVMGTFLILVIGVVYLAIATDDRIDRIMDINLREVVGTSSLPLIFRIAFQFEYAERLVYWATSFRVFSLYPLLGVGLGNMGFFLRDTMPAYGTLLPEIISIIGPYAWRFPNPKNIWLRLLSETGILGFLAYTAWLVIMFRGAYNLVNSKGYTSVIGLAAILALLAQVIEGFSLDSFALPQLWIVLGLATSSFIIVRNQDQKEGAA